MKNVVVTGATGMVGGAVLRALLADGDAPEITSFGRRACGLSGPQLRDIKIANFADPSAYEPHLEHVDTAFLCLATYAHRVDKEAYHQITVTYLSALLAALTNRAPGAVICLFSAAGANRTGRGPYSLQQKGLAELALLDSAFPKKLMFRPGYIAPSPPDRPRTLLDQIGTRLLPLFPSMGVTSDQIAHAMLCAARTETHPVAVYENADLIRLAGEASA